MHKLFKLKKASPKSSDEGISTYHDEKNYFVGIDQVRDVCKVHHIKIEDVSDMKENDNGEIILSGKQINELLRP